MRAKGVLTTYLARARNAARRGLAWVMRRSWRTGVAFVCAVAQRFAKLAGILRSGWIRSRSISPAIDSRRSLLNASSTRNGRTEFNRSAGRPRRTRPNVKQCIWLDIETLMRERILVPYAKSCGGIAWRDNITCEYFPDDCMETVNSARDYLCRVGFAADMCEPALAGIRLRYRTCDRVTRRQRVADHRVGLARIGNAWWFIDNGRWSKRLCLPLGADRFRPPDVWNIRYRAPSPRHEPQPPSQNVPARQPGNDSHSPPANMEPIGRHPEKPAVRSKAETDQQQANEARSLCTNALAINDRDPAPGTPAAAGMESWLLAKAAQVLAFICPRGHRSPSHRHLRGTWLRRKVATAASAATGYVTGSAGRPLWLALIVSPARALARAHVWLRTRLLARWRQT
jgi:hypothetical protein